MCDEEYKDEEKAEMEITPEMLEAGIDVIWLELTGADLPSRFCAYRLAKMVFQAMAAAAEAEADERETVA